MDFTKLYTFIRDIIIKAEGSAQNNFDEFEEIWNKIFGWSKQNLSDGKSRRFSFLALLYFGVFSVYAVLF